MTVALYALGVRAYEMKVILSYFHTPIPSHDISIAFYSVSISPSVGDSVRGFVVSDITVAVGRLHNEQFDKMENNI